MTSVNSIQELIHEAFDELGRKSSFFVLVEEHFEIHLEELKNKVEFVVADDDILERKHIGVLHFSEEGYLTKGSGRNAISFHFKFNFL